MTKTPTVEASEKWMEFVSIKSNRVLKPGKVERAT